MSAAGVEWSVVGTWLVEIHTLAGGAEAPQSAECIFSNKANHGAPGLAPRTVSGRPWSKYLGYDSAKYKLGRNFYL